MTTSELIVFFWIILIIGGASGVVTYVVIYLALAQLAALGFYVRAKGDE